MRNKTEARSLLLLCGALLAVLFFIAGAARTAKAVTVITDLDGQLVKGAFSEVYFVGSDNKRYVFPNEKIFYSWYKDFSTVKTMSEEDVKAIPLGGVVTYKPGARLVKIPNDPRVYAVSDGGQLRWIENEDLAKQLFGDNWAKQVDDVADSIFANYQQGDPIQSAGDYSASGQEGQSPPDKAEDGANAGETKMPAAAEPFKIVSVDVLRTNAAGAIAEDERSFRIIFNRPYTGARLTIVEKEAGKVFFSQEIPKAEPGMTEKAAYALPENWPGRLKPNTAYSWKIVAYAAVNANADQTATASGDFKTSDFTPTTDSGAPDGSAADTETSAPKDAETVFKIVSVSVEKKDALGNEAEDVRSFGVVFNAPAKGVRLIIAEKESGATFFSEAVTNGDVTPLSIYIGPGGWKAKLKPNTTYAWKVVAYAASGGETGQYPYYIANGEFTTSDFTPADGAGNSAASDAAAAQ